MIKKTVRDLKRELKSTNVTLDTKTRTVKRDIYDQRDYSNTLRLLKRLETKYNIDLSQYREKLIYQNKEFRTAIRTFNKSKEKDTFDLQFTDKQLQRTIKEINQLNPARRGVEGLKKLQATQKSQEELADELTRYMSVETGLSDVEVNKYLYPTGEEETSYYEKLMEYVETGYSYAVAKELTDDWYSETPTINNITDVIEYYVDESEQKRVNEQFNFYQSLMLTNLKGYKNL